MRELYKPETVLTVFDLEILALGLLSEISISGVEDRGFDSGTIRQMLLQTAADQKFIKAVTDIHSSLVAVLNAGLRQD